MIKLPGVLAASALAGRLILASPTPEVRTEQVVLAGGCYWGVEAVFEHVRGIGSVIAGFAVPLNDSTGSGPRLRHTSYVEAVRIEYDPEKISYQQLLEIFFLVAHDPTQLDRQGPDYGPQYRSLIFISNPAQRKTVEDYLEQLRTRRVFSATVVTEIAQLLRFREAPDNQQDYVAKNPEAPYVRNHDVPKLVELKRRYPSLYK
jgi:peptide-methionine (S)-S-oxide reductase